MHINNNSNKFNMFAFTIQTKEFLEALKIIKKFSGLKSQKQTMAFIAEILLSSNIITLYGNGVSQKVPCLHIDQVGMVKLSLGLILTIAQESNAKEIDFIFSNGEIRHNNTITYHASIQVSSDKISTFENSLITELNTKPKPQTESKNTPNKNQGQLFIQRDLFEHKGQDKKYIDTILKNKYLEIIDLFFPITKNAFDKLNVKNGNTYLSVQTKPFNKMDFFVNGQSNSIYNENLSYQDLKKNEIDNVLTLLEKAKLFAIDAKSKPGNISFY